MKRTNLLILYSSPKGTTADVARWMARQLPQAQAQEIGALRDLPDRADAVILGAPIRFDGWHRPMRDFARRHQAALTHVPVAGFFTCLSLSVDSDAARQNAETYRGKVADLLPGGAPGEVGGFAGVLDYARFGWPARLLVRAMIAGLGGRDGDFRDWPAMRTWLHDTATRLDMQRVKQGEMQ